MKGSGLLAAEQGLGKTLMLMGLAASAAARGARDGALFVVPQDLIGQWQREAARVLGRALEVIDGPAGARRVARRLGAGEDGWFITYYEALSTVGRRREGYPERLLGLAGGLLPPLPRRPGPGGQARGAQRE